MQLNKLQDEQECVSSLTKEVEEARRAAGTAEQEAEQRGKDVERLREEITGLELVVADMKMLQAKGSQGQRELEMQLEGAQVCISSLTSQVDALRRGLKEAEIVADELRRKLEETQAIADAQYDSMQQLENASKEEIRVLNARLLELQEERDASHAHHKQQIAAQQEQKEALEADLLGNHTEVERLRGKITGLEQVVADMKTLQAKGSQGQRELEMQLYKLQAAQECVSSLAIEVEETLSAAGTAEQEAEQLAKDVKKLSEKTHWLEQAVGDMKRNHSAALAGKEVQIAEMHKAKANLERKRSEDQLRMIERVTKQASTRYARMIAYKISRSTAGAFERWHAYACEQVRAEGIIAAAACAQNKEIEDLKKSHATQETKHHRLQQKHDELKRNLQKTITNRDAEIGTLKHKMICTSEDTDELTALTVKGLQVELTDMEMKCEASMKEAERMKLFAFTMEDKLAEMIMEMADMKQVVLAVVHEEVSILAVVQEEVHLQQAAIFDRPSALLGRPSALLGLAILARDAQIAELKAVLAHHKSLMQDRH